MYLDENGNPLSLDETEELSEFLQGKKPEGYHLNTMPHLTEEQAWTVIYVLQEKFRLIPDHYEKCDKCGSFLTFMMKVIGLNRVHENIQEMKRCGGT